MDEPTPIKDLLYQTLETLSESYVQDKIAHDSKGIITEIFAKSDIDSIDGDRTENYEKFAESLMHYLLTNALIPSQRKITVDQTEVDIVIPDVRTLKTANKDAVILVFPKTSNKNAIRQRLEKIRSIQPTQQNIWLIQKSSSGFPYKTYELDNHTFSNILDDLKDITAGKTQSKFKIFKV